LNKFKNKIKEYFKKDEKTTLHLTLKIEGTNWHKRLLLKPH